MRTKLLLFSVCISCIPVRLQAQAGSGLISPSRMVDWSSAGVVGGIPNRTVQCGSTIAAYAGTADQINSAIAACPSGQFVQLGAGTFNLSTGITFNVNAAAPVNGVTLRGMGANSTLLVFTGNGACNGYVALVCMAGSNSSPNAENNVCDWTSNYSQGSTTISLTNCGTTAPAVGAITNLKIGSLIILDQVDETNDTGTIWNCLKGVPYGGAGLCAQEGTGYFARTDGPSVNGTSARSQNQVVRVTGCTNTGGVCSSGANITISPGLYMPNWNAGQLPQAYFANTFLNNDGVENLSMDTGGTAVADHNFTIMNCYQCWLKGVRSLYAARSHGIVSQTAHSSVVDSYFYQNVAHATQSYGVEIVNASDNLIQNNIWQQVSDSTPTCNGGCEGNVAAYNFGINTMYAAASWFQSSLYIHASGDAYNLYEGNVGTGFTADNIHGTHHFLTLFRNYLPGWQPACDLGATTCLAQTVAVNIYSSSRYFNVIGNVLGTSGYHNQYNCLALSTATCTNGATTIYWAGYTGNGATANVNMTGYCTSPACTAHSSYDPQTVNTLLRWGNWDVVTNGTRWCGNSSSPGWATTCSSTSEVPTSLASYSNPVPATTVLPSSLYLTSKPAWFGSIPFPAIGPDVSNGSAGVCSGGSFASMAALTSGCAGGSMATGLGGHVNANPAMNCALSVMGMPPDGTGSALSFNANACYSSSGQQSGTPPTILSVTVL